MKKIFKALSILAASTALCAGVAMATGCSGYNGKYEGEYSYVSWGHTYGMSVEVTVENNIITKVVDTTAVKHSDWVVVSNPPTPESPWNDEAKANWVNNEAWLLQKYEGLSVTEVIEKKVGRTKQFHPFLPAEISAYRILFELQQQGKGIDRQFYRL